MVLELQKGIVLSMHPVGVTRLDVHQREHKENNMYIYILYIIIYYIHTNYIYNIINKL